MPEVLRKLADCLRVLGDEPGLHVVTGGAPPLEEIPEDPLRPVQSSEVVEDGGVLTSHPILLPRDSSGFTHFLDGKQETHLVLYAGMVPILLGITCAAVRKREADGRMYAHDRAYGEALFAPRDLLPDRLLDGFREHGVGLRDVRVKEPDATVPMLLHEARKAVATQRQTQERDLATEWIGRRKREGAGVLVIDGSLPREVLRASHGACVVGAVKSCTTAYFPIEQQMRCYGLRVGERSSVFRTPKGRRDDQGVFSWYLRLFDNTGMDLTFGLTRLEIPSTDLDRLPWELADQISAWMLAERSPLSKPDPRWDRMAYTIYDCEQYLRSTMPSRTVVAGRLAQLRG
ncbi:MAG TPA: hypothetical protein VGN26_19310 [Armatimonadota bacterium]